MEFKLLNGALFLGDAHFNPVSRREFGEFLLELNSKETLPPQLFFLGDMFDFLANTDYTMKFYENEISLINQISQKTELFYFEGNHDFNLSEIFPNAKVFSNSNQPANFINELNERVQIAHGDIFLPFFTQKSLLFLRNRAFLKFMNFIDNLVKFKISKAILNSQIHKNIYKKSLNFKAFIAPKIHNYKAKFIIEGHYHQDEILNFNNQIYINLNSFGVDNRVYKSQIKDGIFGLKEVEKGSLS
ncbi:MAG: UDP-2,3-diacylglucosamine diphosphatase [Campylobacter sp.]|nr:UDP-2,3-diacylglucosamine diphosphatase [Campylobacter sp.]